MAEVKTKVIRPEGFYDRENDLKHVKKDTVLTVSEKRAKKLEGLGITKRVEEPKAPKKVATKAAKKAADKN